MVGGGGVGGGGEEIRIEEDRVYFISTDLGNDVVGAEEDGEEDHGDGEGDDSWNSKIGLSLKGGTIPGNY